MNTTPVIPFDRFIGVLDKTHLFQYQFALRDAQERVGKLKQK
jgi:hypothetical protein